MNDSGTRPNEAMATPRLLEKEACETVDETTFESIHSFRSNVSYEADEFTIDVNQCSASISLL